MGFSIDHLGIAVKSLAAAKSIYEKLGLSVSPEETVGQEEIGVVLSQALDDFGRCHPDSSYLPFRIARREAVL